MIFSEIGLLLVSLSFILSDASLFDLDFNPNSFLFFNFFLFLAALGLHCCTKAFSSCAAQASPCGGFSLRSTGSRCTGSVVVAHGLCCSVACGIFLDQGWNPCPLQWQADS